MKTLEELEQIRKDNYERIKIRRGNKLENNEKHILVCGGTGCTSSKSETLIENLRKEIEENKIENVRVIKTGCFGLCAKGPIVVIHPEDTFYAMVKPEDAKDIINMHIMNNQVVERSGNGVNKYQEAQVFKTEKQKEPRSLSALRFFWYAVRDSNSRPSGP